MNKARKLSFVYPDKKVIEATKATVKDYDEPLIRVVFWNRFKLAFNYLKNHLSELGIGKYGLIVEVGTSYGLFLPSLCQLAHKVIATDVAETFNFCKDKTLLRIQRTNPNLVLQIADATCLSTDIQPSSCDVIVAFSVLEHIEAKDEALKEISKCLRPSGICIIEVPSENALYRFSARLVGCGDAHPDYSYSSTKECIEKYFVMKEMFNSPFGMPLFKIGVYGKKGRV
ncbi:MAG: class I SAM-dependent methyltransferase [Halobacteriota archaeon]